MPAKIVYKVLTVNVKIGGTKKQTLMISAAGQVTSNGWTNPKLRKFIYVHRPFDNIQDYYFEADTPFKIVMPALKPITVKHTEPYESWVRGVRIHAATNLKVVRIKDPLPPANKAPKKVAPKKAAPKKAKAEIKGPKTNTGPTTKVALSIEAAKKKA